MLQCVFFGTSNIFFGQVVCFLKLKFAFFDLILSIPVLSKQFFSHVRTGFPGLNQYLTEDKVYCSRTQRSASSEAQTRNTSTLSQALYMYCTTALL